MLLKGNESDFYSLSMRLNINYKLEYMEITVSFTNKLKNKQTTKQFSASEFKWHFHDYLTVDFDYKKYIRHIVGTYYG